MRGARGAKLSAMEEAAEALGIAVNWSARKIHGAALGAGAGDIWNILGLTFRCLDWGMGLMGDYIDEQWLIVTHI